VMATAGETFTATIAETAIPNIGARVEVPHTRAIVSFWQPAVTEDNGSTWAVTLESPPDVGDYLLVWRSADPDGAQAYAPQGPYPDETYEVFVPLFTIEDDGTGNGGSNGSGTPWPPIDRALISPTADDVAALERTRIVGLGGGDPKTFTDETHPTVTEVEGLIEMAIDDTLVLLPNEVEPLHYAGIKQAVTMYAATLVESSYFREQLDQGSVAFYRQLFENAIRAVNLRVEGETRAGALESYHGSVLQ
jgi:hypothetical protein